MVRARVEDLQKEQIEEEEKEEEKVYESRGMIDITEFQKSQICPGIKDRVSWPVYAQQWTRDCGKQRGNK